MNAGIDAGKATCNRQLNPPSLFYSKGNMTGPFSDYINYSVTVNART